MKDFNYKFIFSGLFIGLVYSVYTQYQFDHKARTSSSHYETKTEIIDDRDPSNPNDVMAYETEIVVYDDPQTQFYYYLFVNEYWHKAVLVFILWCLVDIVYFPESRNHKMATRLELLLKSKSSHDRRARMRNVFGNLLFGIFISIPFRLIFSATDLSTVF